MGFQTTITETVPEQVSVRITGVIKDEAGNGVPGANLTTLTLTLYDSSTESIINSRNDSDINGVNGGSVDASGNLVMKLSPADNALIGTGDSEKHIALIEWTYNAGADTGRAEVIFTVANLKRAP